MDLGFVALSVAPQLSVALRFPAVSWEIFAYFSNITLTCSCIFSYVPVMNRIMKQEGGRCVLRMPSSNFCGEKCGPTITDNNNYILDWEFPVGKFRKPEDFAELHQRLTNISGVVGTGLFINAVDKAYIAGPEGSVSEIYPNGSVFQLPNE